MKFNFDTRKLLISVADTNTDDNMHRHQLTGFQWVTWKAIFPIKLNVFTLFVFLRIFIL